MEQGEGRDVDRMDRKYGKEKGKEKYFIILSFPHPGLEEELVVSKKMGKNGGQID